MKVFCSYAHEDKALRDELERHLGSLKHSGQIVLWHDREIQPGMERQLEIDVQLSNSDIILLLISDYFIDSDYCWGEEMQKALEKHRAGEARVIPIILHPVDWAGTPISGLQALPSGAKSITKWRNRDEAFENVAKGIRKVVNVLSSQKSFKERSKLTLIPPPANSLVDSLLGWGPFEDTLWRPM